MTSQDMETFTYRGRDLGGNVVSGRVGGPHRRAARKVLREAGIEIEWLHPRDGKAPVVVGFGDDEQATDPLAHEVSGAPSVGVEAGWEERGSVEFEVTGGEAMAVSTGTKDLAAVAHSARERLEELAALDTANLIARLGAAEGLPSERGTAAVGEQYGARSDELGPGRRDGVPGDTVAAVIPDAYSIVPLGSHQARPSVIELSAVAELSDGTVAVPRVDIDEVQALLALVEADGGVQAGELEAASDERRGGSVQGGNRGRSSSFSEMMGGGGFWDRTHDQEVPLDEIPLDELLPDTGTTIHQGSVFEAFAEEQAGAYEGGPDATSGLGGENESSFGSETSQLEEVAPEEHAEARPDSGAEKTRPRRSGWRFWRAKRREVAAADLLSNGDSDVVVDTETDDWSVGEVAPDRGTVGHKHASGLGGVEIGAEVVSGGGASGDLLCDSADDLDVQATAVAAGGAPRRVTSVLRGFGLSKSKDLGLRKRRGEKFADTTAQTYEEGAEEIQVASAKGKPSFWRLDVSSTKVKRVELMTFSRQLAAFVSSGVPLTRGLETIIQDASPAMAKTLQSVVTDVAAGTSFADAMDRHPGTFPAFYLGTLRAAELTGELSEILERLADYIDRDIKVRRKISSAVMYPGIVMAMACVSVAILVLFVLPRFQALFVELNVPLPAMTKLMLSGSTLIGKFWMIGMAGAVTLGGVFFLWQRTPKGRQVIQVSLLRIPLVRNIARTALHERFLRILGTTLEAGVPILRALDTVVEAMHHPLYTTRIEEIRNAIMEGEGLGGPLERSGLLPATACQMVRVGEETGTIGIQLRRAADYYDAELEFRLQKLTTTLEPLVILVIGLIVGFVALSMVTTMYGIYSNGASVGGG